METYHIEIDTGKCTACLRCQLACSDKYTESFNPSRARIEVLATGPDCSIRYTENCISCGTCADECFYGALVKTLKEAG
jgi:ferredoxin